MQQTAQKHAAQISNKHYTRGSVKSVKGALYHAAML